MGQRARELMNVRGTDCGDRSLALHLDDRQLDARSGYRTGDHVDAAVATGNRCIGSVAQWRIGGRRRSAQSDRGPCGAACRPQSPGCTCRHAQRWTDGIARASCQGRMVGWCARAAYAALCARCDRGRARRRQRALDVRRFGPGAGGVPRGGASASTGSSGLAGALAVVGPLAIGLAVDEPAAGFMAALGGLNVALCVPRADLRARLWWGSLAVLGSAAAVVVADAASKGDARLVLLLVRLGRGLGLLPRGRTERRAAGLRELGGLRGRRRPPSHRPARRAAHLVRARCGSRPGADGRRSPPPGRSIPVGLEALRMVRVGAAARHRLCGRTPCAWPSPSGRAACSTAWSICRTATGCR